MSDWDLSVDVERELKMSEEKEGETTDKDADSDDEEELHSLLLAGDVSRCQKRKRSGSNRQLGQQSIETEKVKLAKEMDVPVVVEKREKLNSRKGTRPDGVRGVDRDGSHQTGLHREKVCQTQDSQVSHGIEWSAAE